MTYLDTKLLIIAVALLGLIFLFVRYRHKILVPLLAALVIATLWSFYFRYEYTEANIFLFNRINIYPLVLWTTALTTLQLASSKLPHRYRLVVATILYLICLLAAEAIGYHLLNVRLTSRYTSLLNLGVIHAPTVMKTFYILAGPLFLVLISQINRLPRATAIRNKQ